MFLSRQWTVDGDARERTIPGMFGIFGHGNVAGIGQALKQFHESDPGLMPYYQARNEQAMVHQSVGYARMRRRRATFASTASVGPGSTNMLTGAALATTNRLPALLLPSDTFATRVADPVLQQLEQPWDTGMTVNDAFRPLSRFFDRVNRPEQLFSIALNAMRVLTDPADTGAVTISLPQDVQTEAVDVPAEFLKEREWHIRRPLPDRTAFDRAVLAIRQSTKPFIVAGGGVLYSGAEHHLQAFVEQTGIPVGATQAGVGSLLWDHPQYVGGVGATGTSAANALAGEADLVIGIGTRYSDFTTSSRSAFNHPRVKFVNINVAAFDAFKHGTDIALVGDAREVLTELSRRLEGFHVSTGWEKESEREKSAWSGVASKALEPTGKARPGQTEIIGAILSEVDADDVIVQAAGSLPGDLHKLWRVRHPMGYHVEYAYSTMGYEIAGGLGVKRAALAEGSQRDVIVMVGDGSYLMLSSELATAVAENIKIIVVLVQNHGYASIGNLSESVGSQRFGTQYRYFDDREKSFDTGDPLETDLAMNARSYGIAVVDVPESTSVIADFKQALRSAKESPTSTLIHIVADPLVASPSGNGWWDVPVAEQSTMASTKTARAEYEKNRRRQKPLLGTPDE
jgi:3D-(3,5/4)-trihydroxycyclohexane-1,2-dione acylhydrolase (decyclizing)